MGMGTVLLRLGSHVVKEVNWYHVPHLTLRLLSIRLHRRRHPDCFFLATNQECLLGYPTFIESIDDSEDCLLDCEAAPTFAKASVSALRPLLSL